MTRDHLVAIREMSTARVADTVGPSDSASQDGASGSGVQMVDVSTMVNSMVTSLPVAYAAMDKGSYQQYVGVVQSGLATVNRAVGYQCSVARVASAGSSTSSPSSSVSRGSSAGGSTGGKYGRIAALRSKSSWRPSAVPDGLCYSKLLKSSEVQSRVVSVGEWPALSALLKLPASAFQSLEQLERFRLEGDAASVHVRAGGSGVPFLNAVARVAQGLKTSPGTLGAVVRASAVAPSSDIRLTARTFVGGVGEPAPRDTSFLACPARLFVVVDTEQGGKFSAQSFVEWCSRSVGSGLLSVGVSHSASSSILFLGLSSVESAVELRSSVVLLHSEVTSVLGSKSRVASVTLSSSTPTRFGECGLSDCWLARYQYSFSEPSIHSSAVGVGFPRFDSDTYGESQCELVPDYQGSLSGSFVVKSSTMDGLDALSRFVAYRLRNSNWSVSTGYFVGSAGLSCSGFDRSRVLGGGPSVSAAEGAWVRFVEGAEFSRAAALRKLLDGGPLGLPQPDAAEVEFAEYEGDVEVAGADLVLVLDGRTRAGLLARGVHGNVQTLLGFQGRDSVRNVVFVSDSDQHFTPSHAVVLLRSFSSKLLCLSRGERSAERLARQLAAR